MKSSYLLLIFMIIFIGACGEKTEQLNERIVPVKIYRASLETISKYVKVTGSITAAEDVIVYAKVSEKVEKLNVKPGNRVSKDQILAVQYNELFKQGVDAASASLKTAEAQLNLANQDYERMSKLFEQKAISPQQYDQIKTQMQSSQFAYEQAKVALEQAEEQYKNSFIKAPFTGIAASVYVEKNQMVMIGQPVLQIINPSTMKSKLMLSGKDASTVRKNQPVLITFPSIADKTYDGFISQIDHAVDPLSKTLQVEVQINKPDQLVKSGMFGEFFIETTSKKNSIVIPEAAIQSRTEVTINRETGIQNSIKKYFVFKIEEEIAELREIETGINSNGKIEVTSGLNSGDSIVIVGQNIVKDGQKVKVIE